MWHTQHFTTNPKNIVTPAPILDVLQTTVRKHTLLLKNWNIIKKLCKVWPFIHSFHCLVQNVTIPCVLRSFFLSSLLCTFPCHPFPPTILPSSLTSSCHLLVFLGLPLNLVVPKFIYNTLLGMLFSSILCTCPHQCNLFFFMFCWLCIPVWSLYKTNLTHNFSCMFISILYTFQAAMCPSSGELLYQCNIWFMSLCVDVHLVCRLTCTPDGHLQAWYAG